jgi:hypothetical protein
VLSFDECVALLVVIVMMILMLFYSVECIDGVWFGVLIFFEDARKVSDARYDGRKGLPWPWH